jgi:hypothetical protein
MAEILKTMTVQEAAPLSNCASPGVNYQSSSRYQHHQGVPQTMRKPNRTGAALLPPSPFINARRGANVGHMPLQRWDRATTQRRTFATMTGVISYHPHRCCQYCNFRQVCSCGLRMDHAIEVTSLRERIVRNTEGHPGKDIHNTRIQFRLNKSIGKKL